MIECINSSSYEIGDNEEKKPGFIKTFTEEFKPNPKIRNTLIFSIFFCIAVCLAVNIPILIIFNPNQGNGNIGLNKSYKRVRADDPEYIYIPIIATNNINGNFYQKTTISTDEVIRELQAA